MGKNTGLLSQSLLKRVLFAGTLIGGMSLIGIPFTASAADYYRWSDDQGTTHYGSKPPEGVEAELIKTYGAGVRSTKNNGETTAKDPTATEQPPSPDVEFDPQIAQEMAAQCSSEQRRLNVLQSGKPIKMTRNDGSKGYLSKESLQNEITQSKAVIKQLCIKPSSG